MAGWLFLLAVEPCHDVSERPGWNDIQGWLTCWFGVSNLDHEGWRGADGVVRIRKEPRICAVLHLDAGFGKGRLCQGMVLRHEGELDHVSLGRHDGGWAKHESRVTSYCDLESSVSGGSTHEAHLRKNVPYALCLGPL